MGEDGSGMTFVKPKALIHEKFLSIIGGETKAAVLSSPKSKGGEDLKKESAPIFQTSNFSADPDSILDASLMEDIEMLQSMLASIVQKENPRVYDLYTKLRKHGIDRASNPNDARESKRAFDKMKKIAFDISPSDALGTLRVFYIALNLVNAAEVHHKLRVMKDNELKLDNDGSKNAGPLPMVEDSVRGTLDMILSNSNAGGASKSPPSPDEVFKHLARQHVEIVLTAHPTEGKNFVFFSLLSYRLFHCNSRFQHK